MDANDRRRFQAFYRNDATQFVIEKMKTDALWRVLEARGSDKLAGADKDKEILRAVDKLDAVYDIVRIFTAIDVSVQNEAENRPAIN